MITQHYPYQLSRPRLWLAIAVALVSCAASAQKVTVVDQRDKTLSLAAPPQRLAFIPMPAPSIFMAIDGSSARIVGMNPGSMSAIRGGILQTMFPGVLAISTDIVKGGQFTPNIETLLSLKPDVVFQWADQPQDVIAAIERAGLPVFGMRYGTQEHLENLLAAMGKLAGKEKKAAELIAWHRSVRAKLEAMTAATPAARRPKVLYFQRFETGLRPAGTGSYNDFYVRLVGGANAAQGISGASADVTFEQVLAWDPDVILLGGFDGVLPATLYADTKWRALKAVRDKRVYKVPVGGYRWDPPSHESPLMWLWLYGLLHPEDTSIDLRREVRKLFRFLYSHQLTDAELDRLLLMEDNIDSAHYSRYAKR